MDILLIINSCTGMDQEIHPYVGREGLIVLKSILPTEDERMAEW